MLMKSYADNTIQPFFTIFNLEYKMEKYRNNTLQCFYDVNNNICTTRVFDLVCYNHIRNGRGIRYRGNILKSCPNKRA